jgi:hypothetical protein
MKHTPDGEAAFRICRERIARNDPRMPPPEGPATPLGCALSPSRKLRWPRPRSDGAVAPTQHGDPTKQDETVNDDRPDDRVAGRSFGSSPVERK